MFKIWIVLIGNVNAIFFSPTDNKINLHSQSDGCNLLVSHFYDDGTSTIA